MNAQQFGVIQKLIRGKPESAANVAARLVLVEGTTIQEASRRSGATYNGAWSAVQRYEDAYQLIMTHFGSSQASTSDDEPST